MSTLDPVDLARSLFFDFCMYKQSWKADNQRTRIRLLTLVSAARRATVKGSVVAVFVIVVLLRRHAVVRVDAYRGGQTESSWSSFSAASKTTSSATETNGAARDANGGERGGEHPDAVK